MDAQPVRIPISNVLLGNDYTGKLYIGAQEKEVNLLLDTGSSSLAVENRSYDPQHDKKATVTSMVQEVAYADGSNWIGSVVKTDVTAKADRHSTALESVAVAVAYHETASMFGDAQGILGLAFESLDDAYTLKHPTVPPKYTPNEIRTGHHTFVEPYFMQLAGAGLVANKYSFSTRRSVMRASKHAETDPLNQGLLILGGGEEATDLYDGGFETALVLSDDYYDVNLKEVVVGSTAPIAVPPPTYNHKVRTNAIVDSGTNGLDLAPHLFEAILSRMTKEQQHLLHARRVATSQIRLEDWPDITFVLQGPHNSDARIVVTPENYWQLDGLDRGEAVRSLWRGTDKQSTLGLPLMNGYLTVFDNSANHGLGVVKFARLKPLQ
jgi:hypothetical protein